MVSILINILGTLAFLY